MLSLNWDGKDEALKLSEETKIRLLEFDKNLSFGEKNSGNMIVQGDNLEVLKSLLPFYRGQVKCIYIDPPYNTNAAIENYSDNFPHSDWLSMMYPRLELLQEFLSEDGAIFISIDDTEQAYLKVICDEIFTRKNFVTNIHWRRSESQNNTAKLISIVGEHIVCYLKNKTSDSFFNKTNLTAKALKEYRYKDEKGYFRRGTISDNSRGKNIIEILSPTGIRKTIKSIRTKEFILEQDKNGMIYWTSGGIPYLKIYLNNSEGQISSNWFDNVGVNEDAAEILANLGIHFEYSKPSSLIERILQIATDKNSIILDAFAGSGTTAHAVLNLNRADNGNRKFILVEDKEYCKTITAERVRRVGGSFDFYQLGAKITDSEGKINSSVTFEQLANFVWFSATKTPYLEQKNSPLLGIYNGTAIYLLYNGILKDKSVKGGNVLTKKILSALPKYDGEKIIYGSACRIDENFLKENKIIFRQIPKELNL